MIQRHFDTKSLKGIQARTLKSGPRRQSTLARLRLGSASNCQLTFKTNSWIVHQSRDTFNMVHQSRDTSDNPGFSWLCHVEIACVACRAEDKASSVASDLTSTFEDLCYSISLGVFCIVVRTFDS